MGYRWLCLLVHVVSISAGTVDFNRETDLHFDLDNDLLRGMDLEKVRVPAGKINNISYSSGVLVGLDSLYRTGDCTKTEIQKSINTFDFHFGFRFIVVAFDNVTINGASMSAYFRPRDNSFHLQLTINNEGECRTTLNLFLLETLRNVAFGSSKPDYDGSDVDALFQTEVRDRINLALRRYRPKIAQALQVYVCGYADGPRAVY